MDDDGGATMVQSMEGKELANAKSNCERSKAKLNPFTRDAHAAVCSLSSFVPIPFDRSQGKLSSEGASCAVRGWVVIWNEIDLKMQKTTQCHQFMNAAPFLLPSLSFLLLLSPSLRVPLLLSLLAPVFSLYLLLALMDSWSGGLLLRVPVFTSFTKSLLSLCFTRTPHIVRYARSSHSCTIFDTI